MKQILYIFVLILISAQSFSFIHPKDAKIKNIRQAERRDILKSETKNNSYGVFNIIAGNFSYTNFSKNDTFFSIEYGAINRDSFGYKFGIGTASSKDQSGNTFKTIPVYLDVLVGYGFASQIDSYFGGGFGYTFFVDSITKQGVSYHWLGGLTVPLSPQTSIFAEYNRKYLSIDSQNFDAELIKFGLSFKFYPNNPSF